MTVRNDLLLRALRGEATPRNPVWLMRQAGRYLPEYREVRAKFSSFLDFCFDPDAAAEVTVQPVQRFGLDAAILFSDILTPLPSMGLALRYEEGRGPIVGNPVRSSADVAHLNDPDVERALSPVAEAIAKTLTLLGKEVPLLGFAGGPFTVASYMVEGGSGKELVETRKLLYHSPEALQQLLSLVSQVVTRQLLHQAKAGVHALVVMDSWAGHLSVATYRNMVLPHMQRLIRNVRSATGLPVLHYANGAGHLLSAFLETDADAHGLDWRTDLDAVLSAYPTQVFQGNLDPALLFAPPDSIRERVRDILIQVQGRPHVMNLGHGVLPGTPVEGVQAFVDAVRAGI